MPHLGVKAEGIDDGDDEDDEYGSGEVMIRVAADKDGHLYLHGCDNRDIVVSEYLPSHELRGTTMLSQFRQLAEVVAHRLTFLQKN